MTNKLYQTQQYLKQCTAVVTAAEGNIVTLDRTIFAPEAGGQASDIGTIQGVPMVHCIDRDGEILHELAEPLKGVKPGDEVELELDWMVRLDHMQNHCGEHILSGILFTEHGIEIIKVPASSEIYTRSRHGARPICQTKFFALHSASTKIKRLEGVHFAHRYGRKGKEGGMRPCDPPYQYGRK